MPPAPLLPLQAPIYRSPPRSAAPRRRLPPSPAVVAEPVRQVQLAEAHPTNPHSPQTLEILRRIDRYQSVAALLRPPPIPNSCPEQPSSAFLMGRRRRKSAYPEPSSRPTPNSRPEQPSSAFLVTRRRRQGDRPPPSSEEKSSRLPQPSSEEESSRLPPPSSEEESSRLSPPSSEEESSRLPSSEKERSRPDWLMLDCVLRSTRGDDLWSGTLGLAFQYTSAKDVIFVGIRAVAPPKISCLVFEWRPSPERPIKFRDDDPWPWLSEAQAVAAHRSSILLRLFVRSSNYHNICEEFFVYQASPVVALSKLPTCEHKTINLGAVNNIGILCRDNGDFVVAHLIVTPKKHNVKGCPVTANLCRMFGQESSWCSTKFLPIRYPDGKDEELSWWTTDTVISFGFFICWVDYLRGILFCDVVSPNPCLQYVPLPVNPYDGFEDPMFGCRGNLAPYRSVCVTKDGFAMKFVDISSSESWFYGSADHSSSPYTVTSWTLTLDSLTWIEDATMEADKLFNLTKHLDLPDTQLEFPLVHMEDPQIIYLVSRDWSSSASKACLVAVDMFNKMVDVPICISLRGEVSSGEDGTDNDTTSCNLSYNAPFISCEFSKYLRLDGSDNREKMTMGGGKDELPDSSVFACLQLNDAL